MASISGLMHIAQRIVQSVLRPRKPTECPCNALLSRYYCSRYFFANRRSRVPGDSSLVRTLWVRSLLSPMKPAADRPPSSSRTPMGIVSFHSVGLAPLSLTPPSGRRRHSPALRQGSLPLPGPLTEFNAQLASAESCTSSAFKVAPMELLLPPWSISRGNAEGATSHGAPAQGFHAWGRVDRIMIG